MGSFRKVAAHCGVNVRYVSDYLQTGRPPTNINIGRKLFAEYSSFSRISVGDGRRKEIRWWKRLTRNQRAILIEAMYHYKQDDRHPVKKNEVPH